MPTVETMTREAWQGLADDWSRNRPYAGQPVKIEGGRKHNGKSGIVVRHEVSRFGDAYRYGDSISHQFRDIVGRYGWRCLVRFDDGSTAWLNAEHCEVQTPAAEAQRAKEREIGIRPPKEEGR
jgi:hypothetical protein